MINETIDSSTDIEELKSIVEYIEEDIIFCGHSGEAFQCEINQKKIINVGSITSKNNDFSTYFILNIIKDTLDIQQKILDIKDEEIDHEKN
jgi:predicted phosphodiesterase